MFPAELDELIGTKHRRRLATQPQLLEKLIIINCGFIALQTNDSSLLHVLTRYRVIIIY